MDTGKLIDSMKRVVKSELGSYDTTATVKRVEGNTAWVHIPGGVDETPVRLTMNAKEGDNVQVRVSDGKAFLAGNVSAPPTDDTTAEAAKALANRAAEDAGRAKSAADIAESYATSAQASAAQSANILEGMEQAAIAAGTTLDGIYADAAEAKATTDEINDYADTAGKTVTQILDDGETAGAAAQAASEAANSALVGLSTVEDVVGVLNWITEHGTMTLTSDVTVNPAHVYFIVDPAGDYVVGGTHYSIVSEPDDADIGTYYELSVDESVENYVATHIVVDTEGLWIIPDAGGNKVLIATGSGSTYTTAGTYIVGKVNGVDAVFAKFTADGATMQRGSTDIAHLGYGQGINSGGGTSDAPYYTLGIRSKATNVYDSTIRYYVGNLVLYGNPQKEYCCKVDIETPEAWTPSHWQLSVGNYSTEEGQANVACGYSSHAEGSGTKAFGYEAHSEGSQTIALGDYAHSEGMLTTANGVASHAEGVNTTASGDEAHAEGFYTTASGTSSHAEGEDTIASGWSSHAQNLRTIAGYNNQTAIGMYNDNQSVNAFEIGNGTDINARSNALTVDWSGNVEAAGDVTDGSSNTLSGVASSLSSVQAIQNTYAELYGISSSLTLSTTAKKVPLNGFSGHNCTLSSNGIKVSEAGTYLIAGSAYCTTGYTISDIVHIDIYKNSSSLCGCTRRMYNANPYEIVAVGPLIVTLAANDVIYLYAYNQTGARGVIGTNTLTHLTLHRIV